MKPADFQNLLGFLCFVELSLAAYHLQLIKINEICDLRTDGCYVEW